MFIVLEGMDGSGKSTHAALLAARIHAAYPEKTVVQTVSPTNGPIGKFVRDVYTKQVVSELPSWRSMLHLFMSDMEAQARDIRDWLQRGQVVVSDRFWLSSLIYQSTSAYFEEGEEAEETATKLIGELTKHFPMPDLTILLEMSEQEAIRRSKNKNLDAYEENADFQARVRYKYQHVQPGYWTKLSRIDTTSQDVTTATRAIDRIVRDIWPPV